MTYQVYWPNDDFIRLAFLAPFSKSSWTRRKKHAPWQNRSAHVESSNNAWWLEAVSNLLAVKCCGWRRMACMIWIHIVSCWIYDACCASLFWIVTLSRSFLALLTLICHNRAMTTKGGRKFSRCCGWFFCQTTSKYSKSTGLFSRLMHESADCFKWLSTRISGHLFLLFCNLCFVF